MTYGNSPQEIIQEMINDQALVKYYIQWENEQVNELPAFTLHKYDLGSIDGKWTLRSPIGIADTFTSRKKAEDRLRQIFSTAKERHGKLWFRQGKQFKVFTEK